jgi:hypothetical protein
LEKQCHTIFRLVQHRTHAPKSRVKRVCFFLASETGFLRARSGFCEGFCWVLFFLEPPLLTLLLLVGTCMSSVLQWLGDVLPQPELLLVLRSYLTCGVVLVVTFSGIVGR